MKVEDAERVHIEIFPDQKLACIMIWIGKRVKVYYRKIRDENADPSELSSYVDVSVSKTF